MGASVVKIENLVKRYKELIAVDHINLDIREGEIFGLLGLWLWENHYHQLPAFPVDIR